MIGKIAGCGNPGGRGFEEKLPEKKRQPQAEGQKNQRQPPGCPWLIRFCFGGYEDWSLVRGWLLVSYGLGGRLDFSLLIDQLIQGNLQSFGQFEGVLFFDGGITPVLPAGDGFGGYAYHGGQIELRNLILLAQLANLVAIDIESGIKFHGSAVSGVIVLARPRASPFLSSPNRLLEGAGLSTGFG
ncbi:MAG: hypothetical protein NT087_04810 [Deltaproteobacteria bacterium]|nr:hypothetical protein [Deltaproteobacteria bacterium]